MAIKEFSIFPRAPKFESTIRCFRVISRTFVEERLIPLQRCSWRILQGYSISVIESTVNNKSVKNLLSSASSIDFVPYISILVVWKSCCLSQYQSDASRRREKKESLNLSGATVRLFTLRVKILRSPYTNYSLLTVFVSFSINHHSINVIIAINNYNEIMMINGEIEFLFKSFFFLNTFIRMIEIIITININSIFHHYHHHRRHHHQYNHYWRDQFIFKTKRRHSWYSGYRQRKWARRTDFKSWTKPVAFHIALMPLGNYSPSSDE